MFQKDWYKIVLGVVLMRYPLSIYWEAGRGGGGGGKWLCSKAEKGTKNALTIISKPHAHPHTMKNNTCKVSKWWVQNFKRSCAHKRYLLSIYWGGKWLSSPCGKSAKKWSNNYIQTTCTHHEKKHMQSFKMICTKL